MLHHLLVLPGGPPGPVRTRQRGLAPVEQSVLDAGLVGGRASLPPGRPGPGQVALACPPDGGIAGHITHRVQVDGKAQRPQAHPGGGQGSLNPGVAAPMIAISYCPAL